VIVGFVSVAVNVVLALVLMCRCATSRLALASSLSSYVNVIGLCWLLTVGSAAARLGDLGIAGPYDRATAALALWCAWWRAPAGVPGAGRARLARMMLALVGGVAVYVAMAAAIRARSCARCSACCTRAATDPCPAPGAGDRTRSCSWTSQGDAPVMAWIRRTANTGAVAFGPPTPDVIALGSGRPRREGPRESSPKPWR
jgi:hypothetical protein